MNDVERYLIVRPHSRKMVFWLGLVAVGVIAGTVISRRGVVHTLTGVVLAANTDPAKEIGLPHVRVTAVGRAGQGVVAQTDDAGFFHITLPGGLWRGESVELSFARAGYQPLEWKQRLFDQLWVVRLVPVPAKSETGENGAAVTLSDLRVRYTTKGATITAIGSMARTFQVENQSNVPCQGHPPCSPDGRWRAAIGGLKLDAGEGEEYRNARVSCIAGPCPFARIEKDDFSHGGRLISVSVRNWSDTVTFLLEAEVVRPFANDLVQQAYPAIFGKLISFTLPPGAQGLSLEADWNGQEITFPLGPALLLSWATCNVKVAPDQTRLYSCQLKPGFRVKM